MKINKWLAFAFGATMLCSCADDFDTNSFMVQRPGDAAQYDYLNEYSSLKEYVDTLKYPNMKLGAILSQDALNEKSLVYAVATQNFSELTAPVFHQNVVAGGDGAMDFSAASNLIAAAKDLNVPVFATSLLGNANQQSGWFQGLIDQKTSKNIREVKSEGIQGWPVEGPVDLQFVVRTNGAGGDVNPTPVAGKGPNGLDYVVSPTTDKVAETWDNQFFIYSPNKVWKAKEKCTVRMWIKADHAAGAETQCHTTPGGYIHWACLPDFPGFTTEWTLYEKTFEIPDAGDGMQTIAFNLSVDASANNYYFAGVEWIGTQLLTERTLNLANPKMEEGKSMNAFVVREYGAGGDKPGEILVGQGPDGKNCTVVHAKDMVEQEWDTQFFVTFADNNAGEEDFTFKGLTKVKVSMWIKAAHDVTVDTQTQCHKGCGGYIHWACLPNFPKFTTEWQYYEQEFEMPDAGDGMNTIAFNLNADHSANDYYFADINWEVVQKATAGSTFFWDQETITNGNMTGSNMGAFVDNASWAPMVTCVGEGPDGGNCVKFTSKASDVNNWDSQIFIVANRTWLPGEEYTFEMDVKASKPSSVGTQAQRGAGGYIHWAMLPSNVNFTEEWKHLKFEGKIPAEAGAEGMNCIAICLGTGEEITYEIANVSWVFAQQLDDAAKGQRPLTHEEQSELVSGAFNSWVNNAIANTASYVKDWVFIDKPITNSTQSFNYNSFLSEDYVKVAHDLARAAYVEADTVNNKATDLKLYVNEIGLEDASKMESFKNQIAAWEEAGIQIDGVSVEIAAAVGQTNASDIATMFTSLNALGKPVRVSSLKVTGPTTTFDQLKQISSLYESIVSAYMQKVDAKNQRGIFLDGVEGSLWTANYGQRLPAYAGVAEGLKK